MIIYKITNTFNNKIYIGQTIRSLNKRKSEYKYDFYHNCIHNDHLLKSFNKYGFDSFIFEIIDTATSIEELNQKEIYWISFYNSTNKLIGYNIMEGGKNSIFSDETKEKMSNARKGKKQSKIWIENRIAKAGTDDAKKYGKAKTETERKLLSENSPKYWLNKNRDEETKMKISKSKKGQMPSNCKDVFKIDKKTSYLLAHYRSTAEAAKENPNYSQSKISRICNNKVKTKDSFSFTFKI